MRLKLIRLFLRLALAAAFISAVADRLGRWPPTLSAWGNWASFEAYTAVLNPWAPPAFVPALAVIATAAEIVLALCLVVGFKTNLAATCSGILLLIFAFSMCLSGNVKGALDYSVFTAAAAAFALSVIKGRYLELDQIIHANRNVQK